MLLLLLAAGGIYLVLGDLEEALTLLFFVVVVIGITLAQERKTERALAALRDLTSPRALVIRDGERRRIPGREVVRGDVLVLAEGDRAPADAVLTEATHLEADESLLTGESVPVRKRIASAADARDARPGGDDLPLVYAGSLIVRGHGLAEVSATGARSEMGRIGVVLAGLETGRTPLQGEISRLVRIVATVGLVLCAALVVGYGLIRGNWLQGLLAGIALAMAVLPEELPVILTVFMALGAWRISRSRVLTRRLHAVEALGSATVLCSDKTGTLTENRMRVARMWAPGMLHVVDEGALPEEVHPVLEFGILASQRDPFDPMEKAFHQLGAVALAGTEHIHSSWTLIREYPLSSELLAVSHAWRSPDGERLVVASKGAPEAIAEVCHLPAASAAEVQAHVAEMAADGLRVLAVARSFASSDLPPGQHDFDFELVGLVGLEDPVRAGVPGAVRECAEAGIRVVMITGDSPDTARAIARQVGLHTADAVLTGKELEKLSDLELRERVRHAQVFARVLPEQKLRLVQALRASGEVVAMTGDGVNDAPALKAADIGVAMGGRGTDVAREAAALIVTDDDFTSIVGAVRLGRRVYDNLRRAVGYVLAVHVPIAGLALLPVLLGWPMVLFPVHIAFLQLIIDPACSLAFEAELGDAGLMRRPPRKVGARLLDRRLVVVSILQGTGLLLATLAVFHWSFAQGETEPAARALAFVALVAGNVGLILVNRSWRDGALRMMGARNVAAWWMIVGATATLMAALALPFLRAIFRFDLPEPRHIAIAAGAGLLSLAWFEAAKLVWRLRRPGVREGR
jgi:Ca2+-transporting ATPase